MQRYECQICGFIYDEALGLSDQGIAPNTDWKDIPDFWVCPVCDADKTQFDLIDTEAS